MAYFQNDYDQAEPLLEKGIDMCRAAEHHFHVAFGLTYLGLVRARRGQPDQGQRLCLASLDIFNDIGEPYGQALALDHLGQVTWLTGDNELSKRYYLKALQTSLEIGTMPQTLSAMVGLAPHLTLTGHIEQAAQLLAYAIQHPAGGYNTGQSARRLLAEMGVQSKAEPDAVAPSDEQVEKAARGLVLSQYKTL
ncbi:MAG: tetratricopeptide repeat protein [Anaerolineales bacterium]|nr:tetratricopeptide repeat protein [Anaerolineales bacterium]